MSERNVKAVLVEMDRQGVLGLDKEKASMDEISAAISSLYKSESETVEPTVIRVSRDPSYAAEMEEKEKLEGVCSAIRLKRFHHTKKWLRGWSSMRSSDVVARVPDPRRSSRPFRSYMDDI